jgi:hypothetical protein
MLGWHIRILRKAPAQPELLAAWETSLGGTRWIDALVDEGKAALVASNQGYPLLYSAPAGVIASALVAGPPRYSGPDVVGDAYYKPSGWTGAVNVDAARLAACDPAEELSIEAWDLS